jgi:hypothetical protein
LTGGKTYRKGHWTNKNIICVRIQIFNRFQVESSLLNSLLCHRHPFGDLFVIISFFCFLLIVAVFILFKRSEHANIAWRQGAIQAEHHHHHPLEKLAKITEQTTALAKIKG